MGILCGENHQTFLPDPFSVRVLIAINKTPLARGFIFCGRYWTRTSDLYNVNVTL